jgi:cobalt-zinc-cadmium efflux system protein
LATHSHNHAHSHDQSSNRIGWAFFLNVTFTIIEFIGGWLTNSTAIMADAVHDLGDSLSIGSAWFLNRTGKKIPDEEFTYGYRRLSLFGALLNGVVLLVG